MWSQHGRLPMVKQLDLREVLGKMQGVLFNCDGVPWTGKCVVPSVAELLEHLSHNGKATLFISNTVSVVWASVGCEASMSSALHSSCDSAASGVKPPPPGIPPPLLPGPYSCWVVKDCVGSCGTWGCISWALTERWAIHSGKKRGQVAHLQAPTIAHLPPDAASMCLPPDHPLPSATTTPSHPPPLACLQTSLPPQIASSSPPPQPCWGMWGFSWVKALPPNSVHYVLDNMDCGSSRALLRVC